MVTSYIGADVDSKMTELAVEQRGNIVERTRVFTGIASIREVLGSIGGRKVMAVEEGPLAHWLWRNLRGDVDRLIICVPRRNAYIAKDGDKDNPIDAGKLAELLRGGFVREVYHAKEKLAKYCGVGLIRSASGTDRHGRPKTGRLQLAWQVNGHLKNAVMGATRSAIAQGANVFADRYQTCLQKGMSMTNARHTVARKMLSVMWGMWKSGRPFEPECV